MNMCESHCYFSQPLVIFDDSFENGWKNTGSTSESISNTYVHAGKVFFLMSNCLANQFTGSEAISWNVIPTSKLYFISPKEIPMDEYYGFELWIYGAGNGGQQVSNVLATGGLLHCMLTLLSALLSYVT
jgi:hypothetical protein